MGVYCQVTSHRYHSATAAAAATDATDAATATAATAATDAATAAARAEIPPDSMAADTVTKLPKFSTEAHELCEHQYGGRADTTLQ